MKKITILIWTALLSSCQCFQIKPKVVCDISFQFNRCRCRCIDVKNIKELDPKKCDLDWESRQLDFKLEHCDGLVGFHYEDLIAHVIPEARKSNQCFEDSK